LQLRRRGLLAGLVVAVAAAMAGPLPSQAQAPAVLCAPAEAGVNCAPGNGRTPPGGGTKVPHDDGAGRSWPAISGILWQVLDNTDAQFKQGGAGNDELLGHHGSDHLLGRGGHDIIWGDWDPSANTTKQRDVLDGGPGNDWLYPSHGRSIVKGGPGSDYIWAFYGKGTIDCGPGHDVARVRTNGAFKLRNCEVVKHFCQFGTDAKGNCLSPSGKPVIASRRTG
jgi:hypothetical protein